MMKIVGAVAICLFALPAMAGSFNDRSHDQRRVERSYGSLSRHEARRLEQERRYIVNQRRAAIADGHFSRRERDYLRDLQAQHRRNVWRERRD